MKYIKKFEHTLENKPYYSVELFKPFIDLFFSFFQYDMIKEGWTICETTMEIPDKFDISYSNRKGSYWQVQQDFETHIIDDDEDADKIAITYGLLIDSYGIILGYNEVSFLENPDKIDNAMVELELYKNTRKFNL